MTSPDPVTTPLARPQRQPAPDLPSEARTTAPAESTTPPQQRAVALRQPASERSIQAELDRPFHRPAPEREHSRVDPSFKETALADARPTLVHGSGPLASPAEDLPHAEPVAHPPETVENDPTAGEPGRSSAHIVVGEGDDRVALWIGVRGESVRIEARAHSAAYADALNRGAGDLAAGLADRGLQLGSLSADLQRDSAPRPDPREREPAPHRDASSRHEPTEPEPGHPRPRGVRAIA
jgi:hypothetical protein